MQSALFQPLAAVVLFNTENNRTYFRAGHVTRTHAFQGQRAFVL